MSKEHPNIAVLKNFDPSNMAAAKDLLAEDAVFHYFNPLLPDIQGDYLGPKGFQDFFAKIGTFSHGTFKINPISANAIGDELVVVHTQNTLVVEDHPIKTDVVVVWRIVDGKVQEVWDIPSVYTTQR